MDTMMYRLAVLLFVSITTGGALSQEFLGLNGKRITSLSIYAGVIAVGTDRNGVFWQFEHLLPDTGWIQIGLESQAVRAVYAHKSGPIGWGISAGVAPDEDDSTFVYCSFLGEEFLPNSTGITDSLTSQVTELDGFPDPTICGETYAAGGKALYRREFTASSWTRVYLTSIEGDIQTVKAKERYPGVVLAGGADGFAGFLLIKSTDYGETWTNISPPGTVYSIDFSGESAERIFAAAFERIFKSTDGGDRWETALDGANLYDLTEILYDSETRRVIAAGGERAGNGRAVIVISDNDGEDWQIFFLDMSGPIVDLESSADWTYFVTPDAGVFRFQDLPTGVDEEPSQTPPSDFQLSQNYPNPLNASTVIRYGIPEATRVVLTIYNALGQQISQLVNQDQPPGNYVIRWDASGIKSGVYFYVLRAGGHARVRKTLVLK